MFRHNGPKPARPAAGLTRGRAVDTSHVVASLGTAVLLAVGAIVLGWLGNTKRMLLTQQRLSGRVDELTSRMFTVQDEAAACKQREADLKADAQSLSARVRQLERATGAVAMPLPGIVVADLKGIVREFSPALTPILNYRPIEIVGKPIEMLIPEDIREQHKAAFARAVAAPDAVDPEREILTYGLTKDGARVPIGIRMHVWRAGAEGLITATIRQRAQAPPEDASRG
jgi:PAS domain S-box-containing protein